jgi:hypothetical protein
LKKLRISGAEIRFQSRAPMRQVKRTLRDRRPLGFAEAPTNHRGVYAPTMLTDTQFPAGVIVT